MALESLFCRQKEASKNGESKPTSYSGAIAVHYPPFPQKEFLLFCGFPDHELFAEQHRQWIQEAINNGKGQRESCWTESTAVGGISFVEETKSRLGIMGMGRRIEGQEAGRCVLREELYRF